MASDPSVVKDEVKEFKETQEASLVSHRPITKGYRSRNPKSGPGDESEGDSDSEDPTIVWRGLTADDINSIGLGNGIHATTSKSEGSLYQEINAHVTNGSNLSHQCGLLSATRSIKVGARYACHKLIGTGVLPTHRIAKIKLDASIKSIDLTNPDELEKVGLSPTARKYAENSQEVIICGPVPQKNIMKIYQVNKYDLFQASNKRCYEFAKAKHSYDRLVKFRAYEQEKYYVFTMKENNDFVIGTEEQASATSSTTSRSVQPVAFSQAARQLSTATASTESSDVAQNRTASSSTQVSPTKKKNA